MKIEYDGATHEFPDGMSEGEISEALASYKAPQDMAAPVQAPAPAPAPVAQPMSFKTDNTGRKLNTRDQKLRAAVYTTPEQDDENDLNDLTPANFTALETEIANAKNPTVKATLIAEHNRMKSLLSNHLMRKYASNN